MSNPFGYKRLQQEVRFVDGGEQALAEAGETIVGLEMNAGAVYGGAATNVVISPGSCISNNQRGSLDPVRIDVTAAITLNVTLAANQNSNGAGAAFVGIAVGEILAVHLIQDDNNAVRAVVTEVPAVAEDAVATLAATDVASKLIGFIHVANAVNVLHNTSVQNAGPGIRRHTLLTPSGVINEAPGAGGQHGGAAVVAVGASVQTLIYPPASNYRRTVVVNQQTVFAAGAALADYAGLANGDGDAENDPVITSRHPIAAGGALTIDTKVCELLTDTDGQSIADFGTDADVGRNIRLVSFDARLN